MIVILDNGHGAETKGKRSPIWENGSQLEEWEFNRDIVIRISQSLRTYSIKNLVLVPEKNDIPLEERYRRANKIYLADRKSFGISIHANAHTGRPGKANGFEAYTSIGETESDILAEYLYIEAERLLPFKCRRDTRDGDSDKEARFAMVHRTIAPFVLTESGFMDNWEDCKYMMSNEGRDQIAEAHIKAIINFITGYHGGI